MTSSLFSERPSDPVVGLRTLLGSIIDYAGLFPPAALPMADAVADFVRHRVGRRSWMLGSFVVPIGRLGELESAAGEQWSSLDPGDYWPLSVVLTSDPLVDLEPLEEFRGRWRGRAVVGALEVAPLEPTEILAVHTELPPDRTVFYEVPLDEQIEGRMAAIQRVGAFAKVRTGGVTPEKIPGLEGLARFLRACRDRAVPFKATAGLHHPVRGDYPLTYDVDSPTAVMHGFLNVAIAGALISAGAMPDDRVCDLLAETDPKAFEISNKEISWRGFAVPEEGVARSRRGFYQSFGSCSFEEPVQDLERLGLL